MADTPVWWKRLGGRWAEQNAAAVINQRRKEDERVERDCAQLGARQVDRPIPRVR